MVDRLLHPIFIEPTAQNRRSIADLMDKWGPPHALISVKWTESSKHLPNDLFIFSPSGLPSLSYVGQMLSGSIRRVEKQLCQNEKSGQRGYSLEEQAIWGMRDAVIARRHARS